MDSAPEGSRLMLLSQLPNADPGTKVRFLGCVDVYDSASAVLQLKDRFPATSTTGSASVNVTHVIDTINNELSQVGAWLNVVGYVRKTEGVQLGSKATRKDPTTLPSTVDAVIVWSAGAVKLDEYEAAVRSLQDTVT